MASCPRTNSDGYTEHESAQIRDVSIAIPKRPVFPKKREQPEKANERTRDSEDDGTRNRTVKQQSIPIQHLGTEFESVAGMDEAESGDERQD